MILFDAHFHIINPKYKLIPNQGYLPPPFTVSDYQQKTQELAIQGGAVISGSFQGFDQEYLIAALEQLGKNFVGVSQLPATTSDQQIIDLHDKGIRAVRFNLFRGGSENKKTLESFAKRIYDLVGWHVELYVESKELGELKSILLKLPKVSIDHLGLSKTGFNDLLHLVAHGVKVKATGFSRVDFDVMDALTKINNANPEALMFGTDLPSTRAPKAFSKDDLLLIEAAIPKEKLIDVFYKNAVNFYGDLGSLPSAPNEVLIHT